MKDGDSTATNPEQDDPRGSVPLSGSATFFQTLKWNLWWRGPLHGAICWYLRRSCSGAFHHNQYGPAGRYVVLMTDAQYHRYGKVRQSPND